MNPNGLVSVSYVDANRKTVAAALAGTPPDNLRSFVGADAAAAALADAEDRVQPDNIVYHTGDYSITANSAFQFFYSA